MNILKVSHAFCEGIYYEYLDGMVRTCIHNQDCDRNCKNISLGGMILPNIVLEAYMVAATIIIFYPMGNWAS